MQNCNGESQVLICKVCKVLLEQAPGQRGALVAETAVAGKVMGLNAMLAGSVGELESALKSNARIPNVEMGEAFAATHARVASPKP